MKLSNHSNPIDFSFKRDKKGEELVTSEEKGIEVTNDGLNQVLSIASSRKEDAGIYSVLAQNKLGKVQTKAELIVKCILYVLKFLFIFLISSF